MRARPSAPRPHTPFSILSGVDDAPRRRRKGSTDAMTDLIWDDLDRLAVDTARLLAADAVEKVGNGHPGTAMSLAPVAYLLHQKVMQHDPSDPR